MLRTMQDPANALLKRIDRCHVLQTHEAGIKECDRDSPEWRAAWSAVYFVTAPSAGCAMPMTVNVSSFPRCVRIPPTLDYRYLRLYCLTWPVVALASTSRSASTSRDRVTEPRRASRDCAARCVCVCGGAQLTSRRSTVGSGRTGVEVDRCTNSDPVVRCGGRCSRSVSR